MSDRGSRQLHILARGPTSTIRPSSRSWSSAASRTALKERGLSDLGLFARDPWETLDREGILVPVAYARHGFWNVLDCLADGDLRVREESGYVPWDELRAE